MNIKHLEQSILRPQIKNGLIYNDLPSFSHLVIMVIIMYAILILLNTILS